MTSITVSRHVSAPVDQVWRVATDIAAASSVLSGVDRVEMLSDQPFGVGTRWRETRTIMKRQATEEMWVTAVEPQSSYTVEADSRETHYISTFTFTPANDGGTDVALCFEGHPRGTTAKVVGRVFGPLMSGAVRKALGSDLDDLALAAESGRDS